MKNLIKVSIILNAMCILTIFNSCSKGDDIASNGETELSSKEKGKYMPFFELEKGECIDKGVYREKPDYSNSEDEGIQILFDSRIDLKSNDQSGSDAIYPYIANIWASIRSDDSAPDEMYCWDVYDKDGNRMDGTYHKIDVDLNEGAGGKWIYLYYLRTSESWKGFISMDGTSTRLNSMLGTSYGGSDHLVRKDNNNRADLNDGAGGDFIWLWMHRGSGLAVTQIAVVSSASSIHNTLHPLLQGWTLVPQDLNEGVGGKYIYMLYRCD